MMITFESAKFNNPSLEILAEALKKGLKANILKYKPALRLGRHDNNKTHKS